MPILWSLFHSVLDRCQLRESMLLANKHDLGKLTSCALVILGQIFLSLGNAKVSLVVAVAAYYIHMCDPLA